MKNILYRIALVSLLPLSFLSCSSDKDMNLSLRGVEGYTISAGIGAGNSSQSRVDFTYNAGLDLTWNASDKIDIYSGSVSSATKSSPAFSLKDGIGKASGTFANGTLNGLPTNGSSTTLYAYVEQSNVNMDEAASTVNVDFTGQDGTLAAAGSRNVMFASYPSFTANDLKTFSLDFANKMAMVKVSVNLPVGGTATVNLYNKDLSTGVTNKLYSNVVLDATSCALKSGTQSDYLSATVNAKEGANAIYLCLYPQDIIGLYVTISVGGSFYSAVLSSGEKTLEASKLYSYAPYINTPLRYMKSTKSSPAYLVVGSSDFSESQLGAGGLFENLAKKAIDHMFSVEPYKTLKDYFTVYILPAPGSSFGYTFKYTTTNNSSINSTTASNYIISKIPEITQSNINNTALNLIENANTYFGLTYVTSYTGFSVATEGYGNGRTWYWSPSYAKGNTYTHGDYTYVFLHEFGGHGVGRLGDEYWNGTTAYSGTKVASEHAWSYPFSKNIYDANTGAYWDHMIGTTGKTFSLEGYFEGGFASYATGVWRPELVSVMIDNRPYFNAYSRELIYRRILGIAGETFDYDTFYAQQSSVTDPNTRAADTGTLPAGAEVVEMPQSPVILK
jgi:hypothetical protein